MSVVFIVGAERSGTSAVSQAILQTRYQGFHEGHLVGLLPLLSTLIRTYYEKKQKALKDDVLLGNIPEKRLKNRIFSAIQKEFEFAHNELPHICDKSPGRAGLKALDEIKQIWPSARIIFCKRRGIENIVSRLRKFPTVDFTAHCHSWADCMELWLKNRPQLDNSYLEIEQLEIIREPNKTGTRIGSYLGLTEQETQVVCSELSQTKFQRTSHSFEPYSIDDTDWSTQQRSIFYEVCSGMMERYGYSYDSSYYQSPLANKQILRVSG